MWKACTVTIRLIRTHINMHFVLSNKYLCIIWLDCVRLSYAKSNVARERSSPQSDGATTVLGLKRGTHVLLTLTMPVAASTLALASMAWTSCMQS